ncbi:MAG: alpha/beta hydrolase [Rhodobacteraceae bacterium]|nr:alpha/beta hydrolase [Paracoccaceae bacterium]
MSWQLKALRVFLRLGVKRSLRRQRDSFSARRSFAFGAWLNARGRPWQAFHADTLGPCAALWTSPGESGGPVILYFHGGGYVTGSPRTHAPLARYLARRADVPVCLPQYRLAPEHPFPAAFEDAVAVWEALIARGHAPGRIVLGGDSAGGGLALALLAHLCATGQPGPAALFAFSPFADLTLSGASLRENARSEILLPAERLATLRARILQGADPADPRISPLFGDFTGAPPVFLQVARTEILRDDALRMAEALRAQGAEVRCDVWGNLPHVWQFFPGWLPEARRALDQVAEFLRARLAHGAGPGAVTGGDAGTGPRAP